METKKVIKKMILITIFSLIIIFLLQFIYLVPENHYSILDQTGEVRLEDYPELKDMSFEYNADLSVEYTEKTKEKIIRKIYPLQKEFLRILGRNAEVYDSLEEGRFYIDIYIKDLKTNKTFVIKRDNISIYYESGGPKVFLPSI